MPPKAKPSGIQVMRIGSTHHGGICTYCHHQVKSGESYRTLTKRGKTIIFHADCYIES